MAINRPPGHHAETNVSQGFCPINNAAIAADAAKRMGAERILLIDWDVHHGNGTENIFYDDEKVLYVSIHRYDNGTFYPGTGHPARCGSNRGLGYNVNIAWNHFAGESTVGDADYMAAFRHVIVPIAEEYQPQLVIVSAGFDAVAGDPIGNCRVSPECFGYMTHMLNSVGAPVVLLLEGGYNLQ